MSSPLGAFARSPLGAFVRSPLGMFGVPRQGEEWFLTGTAQLYIDKDVDDDGLLDDDDMSGWEVNP